jgi:hypothetical protein
MQPDEGRRNHDDALGTESILRSHERRLGPFCEWAGIQGASPIEPDTIGELYKEMSSKRPDLLHPNSKQVMKKPWGAQEFAVLDETGVCVIFRQW